LYTAIRRPDDPLAVCLCSLSLCSS